MSRRSAASPPPNLRDADEDSTERCGTCRMYDAELSVCWGYGNYEVTTDDVCDSYAPEPESPRGGQMASTETRTELSAASIDDLPDDAFAHIESGGTKDEDGKTTPRSLRHYLIHDELHAEDALSRAEAQVQEGDGDAKRIATAALPTIKRAAKRFADAKEAWKAEHRDSDPSYEDMRELLSTAVVEKFAPKDDEYAYVCDFGDDWVVFSKKGEKCRCSYELDGNEVDLGKSEPVRTVTSYEPVESKSAPRNPATPKRAFSSLVEQPPSHTVDVQVRMDDTADSSVANFAGYASTTGVPYSVRDWLGEYDETIMPGAFAKTLREQSDIPLLFNHDGVPLASTQSGTSRLSEDGTGLRNEADFDRRDALTNSICVQLQRKVLSKMSFSFRAVKDAWNDTYDDRGVSEAALYDTSIVTYPANPTTTGELVEAMRSALGREGRSLWLAEHELSIRSALPTFADGRELPEDGADLLERALRALAHADEVVCRSKGPHGRARTFLVAQAMLELRAGKTLSAKNQGLLQNALTALSAADKQHEQLAASHQEASQAVASVLDGASGGSDGGSGKSAAKPTTDGKGTNQGAGNGNPINPQDGAGPRSLPPSVIQARRQVERFKRR